jgi:hypothetical protein
MTGYDRVIAHEAPWDVQEALGVAAAHYGDGVAWLHRGQAASPESRAGCAAMATAFFVAGQLAMAIAGLRERAA